MCKLAKFLVLYPVIRQRKYLRSKFGGSEDEMHSGDDEDEEDYNAVSGGKRFQYGADNRDFEVRI